MICFICGTAGCISHHPRPASTEAIKCLPAHADIGATREQVVLLLGAPSMTFDNDRIFSYRLYYDFTNRVLKNVGQNCIADSRRAEGFHRAWIFADHNLLLFFNDENTVIDRKLIRVQ